MVDFNNLLSRFVLAAPRALNDEVAQGQMVVCTQMSIAGSAALFTVKIMNAGTGRDLAEQLAQPLIKGLLGLTASAASGPPTPALRPRLFRLRASTTFGHCGHRMRSKSRRASPCVRVSAPEQPSPPHTPTAAQHATHNAQHTHTHRTPHTTTTHNTEKKLFYPCTHSFSSSRPPGPCQAVHIHIYAAARALHPLPRPTGGLVVRARQEPSRRAGQAQVPGGAPGGASLASGATAARKGDCKNAAA